MKTYVVIPARFASTRLPGKPLADIHGKPMVQWVTEAASRAQGVERVIVATDDERVAAAVRAFGGNAQMTSPHHQSGTDRVAEIARAIPGDARDVFVNVQGDEPLIDPRAIEKAAALVASGRFAVGTLMSPLASREELESRSVVKVVADSNKRAIYFSRFPIPYTRAEAPQSGFAPRKHVGLYAYSREALLKWSSLPPSALELGESLEQLRALEAGITIGIDEIESQVIGVDTPEDLEKVRERLKLKC